MIRQLPQSVHVDIQHSDDSDPIVELVLLSLFTDARANDNDTLPDSSACCRGFIGDAFSASPWGSRLWLLSREKLTLDIRNKAVSYAKEALAWLLETHRDLGQLAAKITVTGAIPKLNTLALYVTVTKPDGRDVNINIARLWGTQHAL